MRSKAPPPPAATGTGTLVLMYPDFKLNAESWGTVTASGSVTVSSTTVSGFKLLLVLTVDTSDGGA
jgi:hypothetical protein